jgi:hypothetical protein
MLSLDLIQGSQVFAFVLIISRKDPLKHTRSLVAVHKDIDVPKCASNSINEGTC